jgi:all-trans-retinol 13,14-reductase
MTPSKASFFIHSAVFHHFLEGGYYPIGGSETLPKKVIPTIYKNGGRVLVGKGVDQILLYSNGSVRGIRMEDGTEIAAPLVISTASYHITH